MNIIDHKMSLVPKEGYNVIAIDEFKAPPDWAYIYSSYPETPSGKAAAELDVANLIARGEKAYVYDKDTR